MKLRLFGFLMLVLVLFLTACGTGADKATEEQGTGTEDVNVEQEPIDENTYFPQLTNEVKENEVLVEMNTSMGMIKIKLFPEQAPKAVENFVTHSKKGYYDGLIFHRVIEDFMIQGGDPQGTGRGGESIWNKPFEDEFSNVLYNLRGAISMANSGPNTNGSQFFIVQNANLDSRADIENYPSPIKEAYQKGGTPWLDNKHTVFGQVIEGMDIVDKIAAIKVGAEDKPVEDVVIKSITVKE
jgi:peptidyl-prolyl cis-trans isomerase B (cyclophilin B)